MYLTSKRLGVLLEGASFGKADKGTETEWYEISSNWQFLSGEAST